MECDCGCDMYIVVTDEVLGAIYECSMCNKQVQVRWLK